MDIELLFSKFYQALKEQRFSDAKNIIYQAHQEGMPAGHILVKLVNRAFDQMQKSAVTESSMAIHVDFFTQSQKYFAYLVVGDRANVRNIIEDLLGKQVPATDILLKIITPAMDNIGNLQARQEISLSQIFIAAKITDEMLGRLLPLLPAKPMGLSKIVIGNAFGDYHGLGRKIVSTFLRFYGFDVVDLGESVPNEKFIEAAVREKASLIFVSALLLHTAKQIPGLRVMLKERKLDHLKIVVGGAPFNFDRQLYQQMGCDGTAPNGLAAVKVAKSLLGIV
jgi:methylmalonyl-CoA mutase cobalamin-binding domain/chain